MKILIRIASFAFVACLGLTASPAMAQRPKDFAGIVPASYLKKWTASTWQVWALPDGKCLELLQTPEFTPFKFLGFRQSPGSRIDMIFGSFDSPRPRTVQMSFNNGGLFDYDAEVEQFADWRAYVISVQGNALSVFPNTMVFHAYVNGEKIFWEVTHTMRDGEKAMRNCLEWQAAR